MEYKVYILRTIDDATPRYVGITTGKLNTRLIKHIHDIKREACKNIHKKNWLAKNKEIVIIEQIDITNNIQNLKEKEIFYIKKFREEGINLLNATDGGDGNYGYKHSAEVLEKMSGENNHRYGKPNLHNKQILGKKIESSADVGKTWVAHMSIREAALNTKSNINTIRNICNGRYTKTRKGLIFRYHMCEYIGGSKKIKKNQSIRKVPVECLIDNRWIEFTSAVDASIYFKVQRVRIIDVCKGRRTHTGGYKFRYKT